MRSYKPTLMIETHGEGLKWGCGTVLAAPSSSTGSRESLEGAEFQVVGRGGGRLEMIGETPPGSLSRFSFSMHDDGPEELSPLPIPGARAQRMMRAAPGPRLHRIGRSLRMQGLRGQPPPRPSRDDAWLLAGMHGHG